MGVDVLNEGICDTFKSGVWEPSSNKLNSLASATEAACVILSIDETVPLATATVAKNAEAVEFRPSLFLCAMHHYYPNPNPNPYPPLPPMILELYSPTQHDHRCAIPRAKSRGRPHRGWGWAAEAYGEQLARAELCQRCAVCH